MTEVVYYSRGYLPHYAEDGAVVAVTFRLADSLPQIVMARIRAQAEQLPVEKRSQACLNMTDAALDRGLGQCWLKRPEIAEIVQASLLHFDKQRYRLIAWVIMPNHIHVVIQTMAGHKLEDIVRSWKGYAARMANQLLGRTGAFWMREYFDRQIRNEQHLINAIEYIHLNPVKAGLTKLTTDWKFSSAQAHAKGEISLKGILG